ncbi:MAG: J domain-containing protein [Parvularcula sp.]
MAADEYKYKPRMGFDIRVKPAGARGRGRRKPLEESQQTCEFDGCKEAAASKVAKSPEEPHEHIWLCATHAREHNRNWNYFDGKSDAEAAALRNQSRYGDRPTWTMAKNGRASAAARAAMGGARDAIDEMAGSASPSSPRDDGVYREGRRLTRLQVQAFRTLNLQPTAPTDEVKKRYTELLKRFHPDQNGGDRSAEAQLQDVIKARQILKKAKFI